MNNFYASTKIAVQKLEAWMVERDAAIESSLWNTRELLEDLNENCALYRSRVDGERLGIAANYLGLGLERARRGWAEDAVVFCCRAADQLYYEAPAQPRLWRLFHPIVSHADFLANQRFRYWLKFEGAEAQLVRELLERTRRSISLIGNESLLEIAHQVLEIADALVSRDSELCSLRFGATAISLAEFAGLPDWIDSPDFHSYRFMVEVPDFWEKFRPRQGYRQALASFGRSCERSLPE
jgi:hypothetical protein